MTQETVSNKISKLKEAVSGLTSGNALISALEKSPNISENILDSLYNLINEARSCKTTSPDSQRISFEDANSVIKQLSLINPRGKQDLAFFPDQLVIKTAKNDIAFTYSAIKHIIILDSIPKDTKGRILIVLHLDADQKIMNGKVHLTTIVLQVTQDQQLTMNHPKNPNEKLQGIAAVVLCQAFGAAGVPPGAFSSPDPDFFISSDNYTGVEAYVKARQGYLFLLQAGICFLESPASFIPMSSVRSVELARANGASSTFDMYVHCRGGTTIEYSTISRNEIACVEGWIQQCKVNVGAISSSSHSDDGESSDEGEEHSKEEESDDDPEDEDFNPDIGGMDEEEKGASKKKKRKLDVDSHAQDDGAVEIKDGENDDEEESDDDDEESDDEESDDDIELVSEDEFSMAQLKNIMEKEEA